MIGQATLNSRTMTVIYFTDGALIDDTMIRRSLLRIPEVIEALRKASDEFVSCDLTLVMNESGVYQSLNHHQKNHLKLVVQNALYKRWLKNEIEPDLIIKRNQYRSFSELIYVFQKLATIEELKVVTIGPGFDELESYLRLRTNLQSSPLNEFISQDPMLNWFWPSVRNDRELHS